MIDFLKIVQIWQPQLLENKPVIIHQGYVFNVWHSLNDPTRLQIGFYKLNLIKI